MIFKFRYILIVAIAFFIVSAFLFRTDNFVLGQNSSVNVLNPWKVVSGVIMPRNDTNGLRIDSLGSSNECLVTDADGDVSTATCGTGGGSEHTDAGVYVYPNDGDYHSAPYYVATSTTATSTFTNVATNGLFTGLSLDEVEDLTADKTFTMAANNLTFNFTTPSTGLELNALGAFADHVLHVHQSVGNPGVGTQLVHLHAEDADVSGLLIETAASTTPAINVLSGTSILTGGLTTMSFASSTGISATNFWGALTGTASGNDVLGQATSTLASHTTTYNHANYDTAYGWGNHATAGYLTTLQLGQLSDVSTTSLATGDVIYWTGTGWARTATSTWDTNTTYTAGDALTLTGTDIDFDGGTAPGGELGGTWASPTLDDSIAVSNWNLTTPTLTTNFTFDGVTVTGLTGADVSVVTGTAGATDDCAKWNADGDLVSAGAACGSGGGGSISGWATTTSTVSGQLNLYPTLATDILNVGGDATTSSEFWVDPNTVTVQINGSTGTSTTVMGSSGNEWVLGTSDADTDFRIASSTAQLDGVAELLSLSKGGLLSVAYASSTAISATTFFGALTGTASLATALGANGGNCSAGQAPLGVNASGAVESCFDVWTEAENTSAAYITASALTPYLSLATWYATTSAPQLATLAGLTSFGTDAATTTAQGNVEADVFGIVGKFFASATQFVVSVAANFTAGFTASGTVDMSTATVKQHAYKNVTWPGTATTTTATTSVPIGQAMVATDLEYSTCRVTSGAGSYQFSDGTNLTDYRAASTTASRFAVTTNDTYTVDENMVLEVGPMTAAQITCGVDLIHN